MVVNGELSWKVKFCIKRSLQPVLTGLVSWWRTTPPFLSPNFSRQLGLGEPWRGWPCYRKLLLYSVFQANISSVSRFRWIFQWPPIGKPVSLHCYLCLQSRSQQESVLRRTSWTPDIRCQASYPYLISNPMTHSVLRPHDWLIHPLTRFWDSILHLVILYM